MLPARALENYNDLFVNALDGKTKIIVYPKRFNKQN